MPENKPDRTGPDRTGAFTNYESSTGTNLSADISGYSNRWIPFSLKFSYSAILCGFWPDFFLSGRKSENFVRRRHSAGFPFFQTFSLFCHLKAPDFGPNLTEYKMAQIGPFYIRLFCVFDRIRDLTGISYDNYSLIRRA